MCVAMELLETKALNQTVVVPIIIIHIYTCVAMELLIATAVKQIVVVQKIIIHNQIFVAMELSGSKA